MGHTSDKKKILSSRRLRAVRLLTGEMLSADGERIAKREKLYWLGSSQQFRALCEAASPSWRRKLEELTLVYADNLAVIWEG